MTFWPVKENKAIPNRNLLFLKKWVILGLFFAYFRLFKQTLQFLQQINVKQCPSNIQCWDSNSHTLEHESRPITTRPGLPPNLTLLFSLKYVGTPSTLLCWQVIQTLPR